jgi:hypothetical protein
LDHLCKTRFIAPQFESFGTTRAPNHWKTRRVARRSVPKFVEFAPQRMSSKIATIAFDPVNLLLSVVGCQLSVVR